MVEQTPSQQFIPSSQQRDANEEKLVQEVGVPVESPSETITKAATMSSTSAKKRQRKQKAAAAKKQEAAFATSEQQNTIADGKQTTIESVNTVKSGNDA